MKIVHISDLHLDAVYKRTNHRKSLKILEYASDIGFDHMVISGDLTENAEKSSFELARKTLKKFGLLNPDKLSLVIGNHDIFGGVHLAEDVINFPKKCKTTDYDNKVNEFNSYFKETFESGRGIYPFIKEFDKAVLIGFNTISRYSVFKNPFASNGDIDDNQLGAFEKFLRSGKYDDKIKIVIAHHHFCKDALTEDSSTSSLWQKVERQTMKLKNKKSIIKLFKKYDIRLVLHGHLHETTEYSRKGIKFLNSGGSILGNNPDEIKLQYINIGSNNIQTYIQTVNISEPIKTLQPQKKTYKEFSAEPEICLN